MAAPGNSRRLIVVLAIGGVAIALFAAYSLFSGGGGGSGGSAAVSPPPQTQIADATQGSTTSTTAPGEPTLPNGQFDVFATRNPFEPAIEVANTADTGSGTTGSDATGGTGTTPDTTPGTGATTPTTQPASQNPSAGTTVAVIDVYDNAGTTMARVQVGSTVYTVAAGQVFATSYKVVSLSGTCGQFLFGDSPFSLCEGEQVIK